MLAPMAAVTVPMTTPVWGAAATDPSTRTRMRPASRENTRTAQTIPNTA